MLISKEELKIIKFAGKDTTRYVLHGLYLTETQSVATDGHRLMVVARGEDAPSINDFPADFINKSDEKAVIPGILHRDTVEAILKASKVKKRDGTPIHNWVWIGKDYAVWLDENHKPVRYPVQWIEGKFPNFNQVIPKQEDRPLRIGFNPRCLADGEYLAESTRSGPMMDISIGTKDDSCLILGKNELGQEGQYIIMPMKL